MSKTLLVGGTVFDGTGAAPSKVDVLIESDLIAGISKEITPSADIKVIDVTGKAVAPGFIDLHSHADYSILAFPTADSALRQGITTIATGNCGGGVAPIATKDDLRKVAFAYDASWEVDADWLGFGDYAGRLDGASINVAPLVAHGPIRNSVMGMVSRPPTQTEQEAMNALLERCLDEGAFGLSTGLEYEPGKWARSDEIEALVAVVGRAGRLYATHMRDRAEGYASATEEALAAARRGGSRVQLSHFAPRPHAPPYQVEQAFQLVADAVDRGESVCVDTFPEVWGPALLIDLFPEWVLQGSPQDTLVRLRDTGVRNEISRHFANGDSFLAKVAGYERIYIADAPGMPDLVGRSLSQIDPPKDVGIAATDVLLQAGLDFRSVAIRHIYATEDDLRRVIDLPNCCFESDGVVTNGEDEACPLLWNASSYGYSARVIEHYVIGEAFLTLSEAIRKMTSLPAQSLGLDDRGQLKAGAAADIVVFDPHKVVDRTTPDRPARHPEGFDLVLVNGAIAVDSGLSQATRAGRLLKPG